MYLNGKLIENFKVNPALSAVITQEQRLEQGENTIEFVSKRGCLIPFMEKISDDRRCLSVNVLNISTVKLDGQDSVIYAKNWYLPEENGRWMSEQGVVFIFSRENSEKTVNISMTSYNRGRIVTMLVNGDVIGNMIVGPAQITSIYERIRLNEGLNTLSFRLDKGCDLPADIENSTDKRCVSVFLNNFDLL